MFLHYRTIAQTIVKQLLLVLAAILSASSTAAIAKPEINIATHYYNISGNTADSLRQQMNSKSTARDNDKTFDGYTRWNVSWKYYWETTASYCSMTTVTTSVDVAYTLPKWVDRDTAAASLKKKWDRYFTALNDHEYGHKEFGLKAAKAIELALTGMGRDTCAALQRDANNQGNKILAKYIALEKQYDIDTRHGMNDGAVFP